MSGLKTLSAASCLLLLCAPVHADTSLADDATVCAGRLSAHLEHQWLMQNPAADRTEAARDAMVALLEAVGDVDDAATLALRIEAKHAHAALLQRATFGRLRNGAEAGRRADMRISACTRLVAGYLDARRDIHLPVPERATPVSAKVNAALHE